MNGATEAVCDFICMVTTPMVARVASSGSGALEGPSGRSRCRAKFGGCVVGVFRVRVVLGSRSVIGVENLESATLRVFQSVG